MADRSNEPSGFARVFGPILGLLAIGGIVAALRGRKETTIASDDASDSPDGHPS